MICTVKRHASTETGHQLRSVSNPEQSRLTSGTEKVSDALYDFRFVISFRRHIAGPSKRDGTAIAGLARKYLRDPLRIIGGSAFDRLIVAGKPSIVALSDGDNRVPSDKLGHSASLSVRSAR
jgi:hypothetical protein